MKSWLTPILLALLLAGCTHLPASEGQTLIQQGRWQEGLAQLEAQAKAHPDNLADRAALSRGREQAAQQLLREADSLRNDGQFDQALALYQQSNQRFGESPRTREGMQAIARARSHLDKINSARSLIKDGKAAQARSLLKTVLAENPNQRSAQDLLRGLDEADTPVVAELDTALNKTVTLAFRDAPLDQVLNLLSKQTGINFIVDKDTPADLRTTIYARKTPILNALDFILASQQLERKTLNANTLLIYPKTVAKQQAYAEKVVKGFYLANSDPKSTLNMLKTTLKARDVFIDERVNMVVIRDTPETVALAEKLIAMQDLADPEVMLEVEVLEIQRNRLAELGIQFPNQFSVLTPANAAALTIQNLRQLSGAGIGVAPNPTLNLRREDGDVALLANPRIRVKNREKARIHIGDRVPVITTTSTPNVGISESVSYLDVGLKLDVEPNIYLHDEVGIKVGLEVSNIVREIVSKNGTLVYQIGTRNALTSLRLKDGETQILAGLINDEDRRNASKLPGLGELPIIGRLFSSHRDNRAKTEIVLLITPHILRNLATPEASARSFGAGTDARLGNAALELPSQEPEPLSAPVAPPTPPKP